MSSFFPGGGCRRKRSDVNKDDEGNEFMFILFFFIGFENSGLTLEFRFLVGIGRSGVMIGRLCLNMGS